MGGIDLERLKSAMADAGFDQSGLARAAGCTPGAINQILQGNVQRSRFLPDIADALGVSLRWLKGQNVARSSQGQQPAPVVPSLAFVPMQVAMPPERALARMFEGLLRSLPPETSLAEQALLLAKRLPIGLSQLRDLLPEGHSQTPPSRKSREQVLATPDPGQQ